MKFSSFRYALLAAVIFIAIKLFTFALHAEFSGVGAYSRLISLGLLIIPLYLGIRHKRDHELNGYINIRQTMIAGVAIALQTSIIVALYTYVHYAFIDTEFITNITSEAQHQGIVQKKSETEIAEKIAELKSFYTPFKQATAVLQGILATGAVLSFILSTFLIRKPEGGGN